MKTILVDAIHCLVIKDEAGTFPVFKEMQDLLEIYPNKKIILTGANDEEYEKFRLERMPWEVFTMKHNPEKTNPEYYRILLKKYKLNADEVVYFEHNADAVKSAQSVGIPTFYYDSDKKDLVALKEFLDEQLLGT